MKKILKSILYNFYSVAIYLEIIIRSNFSSCKYYYPGYAGAFGFGDHVVFFLNIINKLNNKNKVLCYSKLQSEIAKFFLKKKFVSETFFCLPKFMNDSHLGYGYLIKKNNFKPTKMISPHQKKTPLSLLYYGTKFQINLINKKIKLAKINFKLKQILKRKTIVIFIKNYSLLKKKENINFQVRQTRELNKIFKLINYLSRKNINIIILGKENDHFIKIFNNEVYDKKKVFLFKNLSKGYSIEDQIYLASKAYAFIGNLSGAMVFFDILKKKTLLIDCVLQKSIANWKRNRVVLFKKCINKKTKNKEFFSPYKKYSNYKNDIIENNYFQILKKVKTHLKIS